MLQYGRTITREPKMTTLLQYFRRTTRRGERSDTPTAPEPHAEQVLAVPTPGIAIGETMQPEFIGLWLREAERTE